MSPANERQAARPGRHSIRPRGAVSPGTLPEQPCRVSHTHAPAGGSVSVSNLFSGQSAAAAAHQQPYLAPTNGCVILFQCMGPFIRLKARGTAPAGLRASRRGARRVRAGPGPSETAAVRLSVPRGAAASRNEPTRRGSSAARRRADASGGRVPRDWRPARVDRMARSVPRAAHVCVLSSPVAVRERPRNDALIGSRDRSPRSSRVSPIPATADTPQTPRAVAGARRPPAFAPPAQLAIS